MALIQKYEIAYISRTIPFKSKWSPFPLVKLYQICLRNPYEQKNKSKNFLKVPPDGSDQYPFFDLLKIFEFPAKTFKQEN